MREKIRKIRKLCHYQNPIKNNLKYWVVNKENYWMVPTPYSLIGRVEKMLLHCFKNLEECYWKIEECGRQIIEISRRNGELEEGIEQIHCLRSLWINFYLPSSPVPTDTKSSNGGLLSSPSLYLICIKVRHLGILNNPNMLFSSIFGL